MKGLGAMQDRSTFPSAADELLRGLAEGLLIASEQVPSVLSGEVASIAPVVQYIRAQRVTNQWEFQLPEPILHPIDNPEVLVVGFNPNYGEDEIIPRYGSTLEEYVDFYANRFAPHRRDISGRPAGQRVGDRAIYHIGHYTVVERLLAEVLGTEAALGINTVYCDAISWKWKRERFPGFRKADAGMAYQRLERIMLALQPKVILTLGDRTARIVGDWTRNQPRPGRTHGDWPVWHVATYHPDARGGKFHANRTAIQSAIATALTSERPERRHE